MHLTNYMSAYIEIKNPCEVIGSYSFVLTLVPMISRTTIPKAYTVRTLCEAFRGSPLKNHSTLMVWSPRGISIPSK